jgi:chromosome segregation ATPase
METQRVDLGTYKSSLGRLESKYDDVVAQLDEANSEIVERESGIEKAGGAIFDLRAQIDRLNGELAEAEASSTKTEAERDRIQLLFNVHRKGQPSKGLRPQQNLPRGIQTSPDRGSGLPATGNLRPVPTCM